MVLTLGPLPPRSNLHLLLCAVPLQRLGGRGELLQPSGHGLCCSALLRRPWSTSRHLTCIATFPFPFSPKWSKINFLKFLTYFSPCIAVKAGTTRVCVCPTRRVCVNQHSAGKCSGWVGLVLESRAGTCWMLNSEVLGTSASPGWVGPCRRQGHGGARPGLELGLLSRTSPCPPVLGGCLCLNGSSKRPGPPRGTRPPPSRCSLCPTTRGLACALPCHQILGLRYRILCRRWVMLSDGLHWGGRPSRRGVLLARTGGQNLQAILSHPSALNFLALPTVRH